MVRLVTSLPRHSGSGIGQFPTPRWPPNDPWVINPWAVDPWALSIRKRAVPTPMAVPDAHRLCHGATPRFEQAIVTAANQFWQPEV